MSNCSQNPAAMTTNQKSFDSTRSLHMFSKYKKLVVGSSSVLFLCFYELYCIFIQSLPSLLGLALRKCILPFLFKKCSSGPMVAPGVVIRNPQKISLGKNVIIDRNVTLDVRELDSDVANELEISDSVFIGTGSLILAKRGSISLGKAVNISSSCRIASEGSIRIGESCLISAYCYIGPGNHKFSEKEIPVMQQGMEEGRGVFIGKNVWIGARATILDGVSIGDNVVVAAHSFVRDDVPEGAIVGGTPARILKQR